MRPDANANANADANSSKTICRPPLKGFDITIGPDSLYCGKWGKVLNAYSDLDLDPMKLNIELVRAIFIYYNVFRFCVPRSISF